MFLFFCQSEPQCSYKLGSYSKKRVYVHQRERERERERERARARACKKWLIYLPHTSKSAFVHRNSNLLSNLQNVLAKKSTIGFFGRNSPTPVMKDPALTI